MRDISVKTWIYFGAIFLFLIVLIFPDYFSLDEPNVLWALRKGEALEWYKKYGISEGRPIFCFLQIATIGLCKTLANLKYLRVSTIIMVFLVCRMFFTYLQKIEVPQSVAFICSIVFFSLPGFTAFICWAECSTLLLSLLLSFYAGSLAVNVFANQLGDAKLSKSKENLYIFLAISIEIVSLFNYQSFALAFVLPAFFILIRKPFIPNRKRLIFFVSILIVFVVSLGIYYELFKSSLQSTGIAMVSRGKVDVGNLPSKLIWFTHILYEASKLQLLLFKNIWIVNIFSVLISMSIIRDVYKKRFLDVFFLFSFCLLLFLPHLLIADSWGASRNFLLISVVMSFYLILRVVEVASVPSTNVSAIVGVMFVLVMGYNGWEGWVKPMKKDYSVMNEFVQKLPVLSKDTLIINVTPPQANMHEKKSALISYFDEFNAPVFFRIWPIEPAMKCLYMDMHPDISINKINGLIKIRIDTTKLPYYETTLPEIPLNLNYR